VHTEADQRYSRARSEILHLKESTNGPSELDLQAQFYAGDFGLSWTGVDGEAIEMIHPGEWNREPGPDFIDAEMKIDGVRYKGDIELDRRDLDWSHHGHDKSMRFRNVTLHVFLSSGQRRFFTRTDLGKNVTQVLLSASTGRTAASAPLITRKTELSDQRIKHLIELAWRYRYRRQRANWQRACSLHGHTTALFYSFARSMGYRKNEIPFLLTAQRVGKERAASEDGLAWLFGVAGFLKMTDFEQVDEEGRVHLRGVWDRWWRVRSAATRLQLPTGAWEFGGTRPVNHPHRRMAALATLAQQLRALWSLIKNNELREFTKRIVSVNHPYWDFHCSFGGKRQEKATALIGQQRAHDIVANIFAPTREEEEARSLLQNLKAPSPSGKVIKAAEWFLPSGDSGKAIKCALHQQGLLQLYKDFYPLAPEEISELIRDTGQSRPS